MERSTWRHWHSDVRVSRFQLIAVCVISFFVAKWMLDATKSKLRRLGLARKFGCEAIKSYYQLDRRLGLLFLYNNINNFRARKFLESWDHYLTTTGKTFGFWVLGQRMMVTTDPENVKTLLATSFDDFEKGPELRAAFSLLTGDGIFAVDGKQWHWARTLLRPSFTKSEMSNTQLFEAHYQSLLRVLPADGVAVDLQGLFSRLTMDTATDLLFGSSMNSLEHPDSYETSNFASSCEIALGAVFRDVSIGSLRKIVYRRRSREAREGIYKVIDQRIQEALQRKDKSQGNTKRHVFIDHLMESTRDPSILRDQSVSALLGGRETTASLLSNLLHTLARKPDIWDDLREEVLSLKDRTLDQESCKEAVYLSHCVKESLRLHPVIPINVRWCNKDTVLPRGGGPSGASPILVPKGTQVYMALYSMHRDPNTYGDDAHEFRPERWDDLKPGWNYVPFSGGPRMCVGQQLALTEATYTMLRLLQSFKAIEAADEEPWRENLSIAMSSASGCKVRLYRARE
ncbi:hypothetical protein ACLMJK_009267 [Lecanora helva]